MLKLIFVLIIAQAFEINVYRMVGVEQGTEWLGTKVSQFQLLTTHWKNTSQRKISLIKLSEITQSNLQDLLAKKPGGVAVILENVDRQYEVQAWNLIEKELGKFPSLSQKGPKGSNIPIYFTHETEQINQHYSELIASTDQDYQMQVSSTEVKHQLQMEDYYNMIEGIGNFKQNNPSTMFVLSLDQNLISAEIDSKSIGLQYLTFFKIAREFRYHIRKDRNFIFYLTTTQSVEEFGLKQFLKKQEHTRIAATIDTVIIFDSIHSNQKLYISHTNCIDSIDLNSNYELVVLPQQQISNKDINVIRFHTEDRASILSSEDNTELAEQLANLVMKMNFNQEYVGEDSTFEGQLVEFFNSNLHPVNLQKDTRFILDLQSLLKQLFKHTGKVQYQVKDRKYHVSTQIKSQIIRFYSAFIDLYFLILAGVWLFVVFGIFKYLPIFKETKEQKHKR